LQRINKLGGSLGIGEFFQEYFIDPTVNDLPYNIYNTLGFAIILIGAVALLFPMLQKAKIKIDKNFILAVLPYVVFGSAFRTWEDAGAITHWFFVTPGSYLITFGLLMIGLLVGLALQKHKKIPYHKPVMYFGIVLALLSLFIFRVNNWFAFGATLAIFAGWFVAIHYLDRYILKVGRLGSYAIKAHMFDASATFVALQFFASKYAEQHVLPGFLIETVGPASFFVLKLLIIIPIVWFISKQTKPEERDWKNYLLLIILILGLAPGLRDFLRISMFV
jgi:uncharacterized membrane protein